MQSLQTVCTVISYHIFIWCSKATIINQKCVSFGNFFKNEEFFIILLTSIRRFNGIFITIFYTVIKINLDIYWNKKWKIHIKIKLTTSRFYSSGIVGT